MFRFFLLLALIFGTVAAQACSCCGKIGKQSAHLVFAGKVTAVTIEKNYACIQFEVYSTMKGPKRKTMIVRTELSVASCGFAFFKDKLYLVYCTGNRLSGYHVSHCSRTKEIDSYTPQNLALENDMDCGF